MLPIDGKNRSIIQRYKPECNITKSIYDRYGLKDDDLIKKNLFEHIKKEGLTISEWINKKYKFEKDVPLWLKKAAEEE